MKKMIKFAALALAGTAFLASCASKPAPAPAPSNAPAVAAPRFVIIEHKNMAFGGDVPSWVTMDVADLEAMPEYKDKYVFIFDGTGENLQGTQVVVNNLNAGGEIARFISLRVQALFTGAQVGDNNAVETYFENIVKSLADTTVTGFRKVSDYWVLREFTDTKKRDYNYRVLYTIDKKVVDELLNNTLNGQQADSPEEVTAKDRVKTIIQGSLPALN